MGHAEGGAFLQAFQSGEVAATRATWVVDRGLCGACRNPGGTASLAQRLGLQELEVYERFGNGVVARSVYSAETGWTQRFLGGFIE